MKKLYKVMLAVAAVMSLSFQLDARRRTELVEIRPSIKTPASSYVIFVDIATYNNCEAELKAYRSALEKEGLGTYIYAAEWRSPEQVRGYLYSVNAEKTPLEGVIFVGDIPVVKVKGAAHLASSPKRAAEKEWIVTDRFYDDYQLDFNYCGRDSLDGTFTYELSSRGRQDVFCDIYSSRIVTAGLEPDKKYEVVKEILSAGTAARGDRQPDGTLRLGHVNKWVCTIDNNLRGDQTVPLTFNADAQKREIDDFISVYAMTDDALARGASCSDKLLEMLKKSHSPIVRKAALSCLSQFADDNCVKGVEAGLEDFDASIRELAAGLAAEMGIFPEHAAESNLQHGKVPEMVEFVLDENNPLEQRIAVAGELGLYSRSYNREKITEGLSVALSRKYMCPQPLREEILKTLRRIR